jgi:hypothetical protein
LFLGGLRLPPHRVALIVLSVTALTKLLTASPIRFMAHDYLFLIYGIWSLGIYIYHEGEAVGIPFGGSLALESFCAYLVARVYITRLDQFKATIATMLLMVMLVAALALGETALGRHWVHDLLGKITGYEVETGVEFRRGLIRVYSTFDHPIHYGTFCASILALGWALSPRMLTAARTAGIVAFSTFLSLSSAPMLTLILQAGLLSWERITRGIPRRVILTLSGAAAVLLMLGTVSDRSPAAIIATGFTLDSWTGFYRLLIWEHGLENVARSPMLGIGMKDWSRAWWMVSDSIDAFWLVIMMRMGIPALVVLLSGIALLMWSMHRQRVGMTLEIRRLVIAWSFSLIALSLAGCTVHYWNAIHAYFFFFLGITAWVGDPYLAAKRAAVSALQAPRQKARHTSNPSRKRPAWLGAGPGMHSPAIPAWLSPRGPVRGGFMPST